MPRNGTPRRRKPPRKRTWRSMSRRLYRRGVKGRARPRRSLRQSYKGIPNQYRFVREGPPFVIDVGNANEHTQILSGLPNMSMLDFQTFQMNRLVDFDEFGALFTSYKLDRLELIMTPMWQSMPQVNTSHAEAAPAAAAYSIPNLMMTRVSTRYTLNDTPPANADDARATLAQTQMKTRTLYGSRKALRLITNNPNVATEILQGLPGAVNIAAKTSPWLSIAQGADQRFLLNDRIYCERIDGQSFPMTLPPTPTVYLYRCFYKAYFRVAKVR